MPRHRRKHVLEPTLPDFDIARQWKHPGVWFVLALILTIFIMLGVQGSPPISSILVLDVSESALNNPDWTVEAVCDRYQRYLQRGDYQADIWFADKARIVVDPQKISRSPNGYACRPTPKRLDRQEVGRAPGTSLHQAVLRTSEVLPQVLNTHADVPVLVTVVLNELDGPNDLGLLAQEIGALADSVQSIRILGPDGETATNLRQLLAQIPSAQFCSLSNAEQAIDGCLGTAFQAARASNA